MLVTECTVHAIETRPSPVCKTRDIVIVSLKVYILVSKMCNLGRVRIRTRRMTPYGELPQIDHPNSDSPLLSKKDTHRQITYLLYKKEINNFK